MVKPHYPIFLKGHPKLYWKRKPIFWWVHKWVHARFIIREFTSVPVAYFSILLLLYLKALHEGPGAFQHFQQWLAGPVALVLNGISLLLILYHSFTWFNLTPKALVIKIGTKKLPGALIIGANFGAWIIISVVLAIIIANA